MKTFKGIVLSDNMDKTIVVEVSRQWTHPLYKKTVRETRKFMVHDEHNSAQEGDLVVFEETTPKSKNKRFQLVKNS